jgi:hypothetical protein
MHIGRLGNGYILAAAYGPVDSKLHESDSCKPLGRRLASTMCAHHSIACW